MKCYPIDIKQDTFYIWYQYIREIDIKLQGLYEYINLYNPNYFILNHNYNYTYQIAGNKSKEVSVSYLNSDELVKLNILHNFVDSTGDKNFIYAVNLPFHKGLVNNFDKPTFLTFELPSFQVDADGKTWKQPTVFQEFEEATTIISLNRSNYLKDSDGDIKTRSDPNNYLIFRTGSNGIFYTLASNITSAYTFDIFTKYQEDLDLFYTDNTYIFTLESNERFYYTPQSKLPLTVISWSDYLTNSSVTGLSIQAYTRERDDNNKLIIHPNISSKLGSIWTESLSLDHSIWALTNSSSTATVFQEPYSCEEILMDDICYLTEPNIENNGIPIYNIIEKDNQEVKIPQTQIIVNLF